MHITPLEANAILFAFDKFFKTDSRGNVTHIPFNDLGLSIMDLQDLRDRLLAHHDHPRPPEEDYGS